MPTRRDTGPDHEGGFGLHILDTVTTGWGVRAHRAGKTVWADIDAPTPPRTSAPRPVRSRSGAPRSERPYAGATRPAWRRPAEGRDHVDRR
ncbi:hypothetical protein ACIBSV_11850 [Embleya sp. NPDC050154]|uniref:hypothetical protein n=1 Tax=Embleya sp. NPDC050154 TaxID=3363988 RepID=UPI00379ED306